MQNAENVVLSISDKLIHDGEAAVDQYNKSRDQARAAIMPMAKGLLEARRIHPSNQAFGDWLLTSSYRTIGYADRAALINIGENEAFATKYIAGTKFTSPQTIWQAIGDLLPSSYDKKTPIETENVQSPVSTAPEQSLPETMPVKSDHPSGKLPHKSVFKGLPRGEEVHALYTDKYTRSMIGKAVRRKGGSSIWKLILEALDNGFLIPNNISINRCSLRILFPLASSKFCSQFDLTKNEDRKRVTESLWPAALANRDAIIAAPEQLGEIIKTHYEQHRQKQEEEAATRRLEAARAEMRAGQTEVIMFGDRYWPIVNIAHPDLAYSYEELRVAVWTFKELYTLCEMSQDNSPKSCGVRIRLTIKFLNGYLQQKVMNLLTDLSRSLEKNPEGEQRPPLMPNMDREPEDWIKPLKGNL